MYMIIETDIQHGLINCCGVLIAKSRTDICRSSIKSGKLPERVHYSVSLTNTGDGDCGNLGPIFLLLKITTQSMPTYETEIADR